MKRGLLPAPMWHLFHPPPLWNSHCVRMFYACVPVKCARVCLFMLEVHWLNSWSWLSVLSTLALRLFTGPWRKAYITEAVPILQKQTHFYEHTKQNIYLHTHTHKSRSTVLGAVTYCARDHWRWCADVKSTYHQNVQQLRKCTGVIFSSNRFVVLESTFTA